MKTKGLFAAILIVAMLLCGCGRSDGPDENGKGDDDDTRTSEKKPASDASDSESGECDHVWQEWTIVNHATCEAEGLKERTCEKCSEVETQSIPKTEHTVSSDWMIFDEDRGERAKVCIYCGEVMEKEYLWAEFHCEDREYFYSTIYGNHYYLFDKKGEVIYTFEDNEKMVFYTKDCFISKIGDVFYLKDATGAEITSSEKLGVTGFGALENDKALSDGYVFVYKTTESFDSVKYEVGVIDISGEWVVPLSDSNPILQSGMECSAAQFESGIEYVGGKCFIIKTGRDDNYHSAYRLYNFEAGRVYDFSPEFRAYSGDMDYYMENISFNSDGIYRRLSDDLMYEFHTDGKVDVHGINPKKIPCFSSYGLYVDDNGVAYTIINDGWGMVLISSDGKIAIDYKDDRNINITDVGYIGGGKWLAFIKNNENTTYYTIINTDGEFLFEPKATNASCVMMEDGNSLAEERFGSMKVILIDEEGNVLYETDGAVDKFDYKNGIIYTKTGDFNPVEKYFRLESN